MLYLQNDYNDIKETYKLKKNTLNNREQTDGHWSRGGGWQKQVTGMKEGACHDEHWLIHRSAESLYYTPEINITVYAYCT